MGVLPYIVVVYEVILLTQNHQRKRKKGKKIKKQQTLKKQTVEIKQFKQIDTFKRNYSSSPAVELHPPFRDSKDHSTHQT